MNIHVKNTLAVIHNNGVPEVKKSDIYISGSIISAVGKMPDGFRADKTIDGDGFLTIPGLVNCHTHAYMTLYRNLADDLTFEDWLFKSVMPVEDKTTGEEGYWGSLLGYAEMLKTGTTSFLDMHMFRADCARAADTIGIRGVLSRGLIGFGRNDEGGIKRINELKSEMEEFKNNPRLSFMVAPHSIYTTDREYLELCAETAGELDLGVHIHVSETKNEVENSYKNFGKSPVEYIAETGLFKHPTVAAHCVHLSEKDIDILAEYKVNVAANPKSNLKLANGVAPIPALIKKGVNVCLGTDSAASNNSLNLFGDMNNNSLIHKGVSGDPQAVTAAETFNAATVNGARALNINTGVIETGKKADIVMLNLNRPQFIPRHNLIAALVYSANGSETDTVIVDGNIVVQGGRLTMVDENEVYAKADEALKTIKSRI